MAKQTTLLDLNMDVLDKIFKELNCIRDKINLAKTHSHLTKAFAYHGRFQFKEICFNIMDKEEFLFLVKNCGENIQKIFCFGADVYKGFQLMADNCPNLNEIFLDQRGFNSNEMVPLLAKWQIRTLSINRLPIYGVLYLLRKCKTLRKLVIYNNDLLEAFTKNINSIIAILDILNENGVKPDAPFTLSLNCFSKHFYRNLITTISKLERSDLLNIEFVIVEETRYPRNLSI